LLYLASRECTREEEGSSVDWYRYQKEILMAKLISYAQRCGPDAIFQEDLAPSHAHHAQQAIFDAAGVARLL
jgi:hypothetical protein